jgi:hypothetical protein
MAQENPKPWAEWVELARSQILIARDRLNEWVAAVREEPARAWQTPAVRYGTYAVGGLAMLWIAVGLASALAPPPPADARPTAKTADFHVVCSNERCGHHFVIHRRLGFHKFPVVCPKCEQKTGMQARRCNSPKCRGRWVAPQRVDGQLICPKCGRRFE